ncbi:CHAT domain-containing protein [Nostoc sp. FACHB-280]|uniref:CHAT domain-containing tetratricopeptide repeat protein n=1 Tax=Nostoc sp. FACHB-280 TaxID=2692839 RepID=UPI00168BC23D|nr:CHAT domain-containing protein [Nostoc sp. FACHB-280]MBD2495350.1 CHAT domain-containing protein [Nostoc sp. FACHB-280]
MFNQGLKSIFHHWLKILFVGSLILCIGLSNLVNAQTPEAVQLVNQGIASYQKGDFQAAIQPWQSAVEIYQKNNDLQNVAIVNENLARAYQQLGDTTTTLNYWEKVLADYRIQNDWQKVGRVLTEIAQVYTYIGQTQKAISFLCGTSDTKLPKKLTCQPGSALQIALEQNDKLGEIAALGSLGEAYRLQGNYDLAIKYLEAAKNSQNQTYNFAIFNSLGNAHASRAQLRNLQAKSAEQQRFFKADLFQTQAINDYQLAKKYVQSSIELANQQNNYLGELRSHLNLIQLAYRSIDTNLFNPNQVETNIYNSIEILKKLPDSIDKVYAAIDLANLPTVDVELTSPLTQCFEQRRLPEIEVKQLFNQAIKVAKTLQNQRAESYALGVLGHFYECQSQKDNSLALELTNKAIWLAEQNLQAKDSLYLWEWQAGRILLKQGKINEALLAYQRAYNTLEELRNNILITNRDFQFDFRDIVEPVYRELAQVQLDLAISSTKDNKTRKQQLSRALATINSLRLAEIQNYFGNDCILQAFNQNNTNQVLEKDTAVISSIILKEKTGILLSLPNQEEHLYWIDKNREVFQAEIANFRNGLLQQQTINYDTSDAENLYDLIIRPLEKDLVTQKITTLVFVQDGFLRDIPMAALYDQKASKYLIEKYAIATTSSLQLTNLKKSNFSSDRALVLALTQESEIDGINFDKLAYSSVEFEAIKTTFPKSKKLENEQFLPENVQQEIQNQVYPIIHILTHAQFGILPEDTFLVAGNNQKITIDKLEMMLRKSGNVSNFVELLTLTACETATGNDRATLGLAGVALQAGTKSALASLWSVDDESTAYLIAEFYNKLRHPRMSKAQALQAAQIELINAKKITEIDDRYDHPYYWSAFIMIGNWL